MQDIEIEIREASFAYNELQASRTNTTQCFEIFSCIALNVLIF